MLVHTGQHYDHAMSEIFFEELGVGEPDHMLGVGSGSHAQQTARVMERLEPVLLEAEPDLVLVPGDVNSTLAAALAAAKLGIPSATSRRACARSTARCPRRSTAIVTDQLSRPAVHPLARGARQPAAPRAAPRDAIHDVGNTMIDTLVAMRARIDGAGAPEAHGLGAASYLVVTLHRPALVDGPLLAEAMARSAAVAERSRSSSRSTRARAPRSRRSALDVDSERLRLRRAARLPRVPEPRRRLGRRAHRLGRDPGGDDLPRRAVLHAARQHRAAGDGRRWARTCCSGSTRRGSPRCPRC